MPEAAIPEEIVNQYHELLKAKPDKLNYLKKVRGLDDSTIAKYKIGYQPLDEKHPFMTDRYTIPIKDKMGTYVNIRKWRKQKDENDAKIVPYQKGYGEGTRLFPIENMYPADNKIIICEGEWDCLLLNQYKFNAVTKTSAVDSWDDRWNDWFKGKDVIFIYDCDDTSRAAAEKHKNILMPYANSIKIIDLELPGKGEDITDWFVKYNKSPHQLAMLIRKSKVKDIYELIDLSQSLEAKYYNQKIKFNGIVVGKDLQPFIIPQKIEVKCNGTPREGVRACEHCVLRSRPIIKEFIFEEDKENLVAMTNTSNAVVMGFIRKILHLPSVRFCPYGYTITNLKTQNIEMATVIPEINHEIINQEYVVRTCFYFGSQIKLNQGYLFRGTTVADPNTQSGIHLITNIKEARDNISKFQLDNDIKRELKIFRPERNDVKSIKEKLDDIYNDFTFNITKMYERKNLLMAIDLVYHSILNFHFLDRLIKKGWLECLIVGDTKCGKSETAENIIRHYKSGEFITSGEHTSRAGLLGGEQQTKRGSWNVTWGKLVMNNKGLIVLDEADELSKKEIIGQLSGVRSSGVAELVQIQAQKANARTRIIWISNPLWGRMSEHNYGVETIKELFKTQQDISRIDFAVAAAGEDVSDEIINKRHKETYKHKYTSKVCHNSVMFAWSRTAEQVRFTKDAEDMILKLATEMGKEYSPEIPLVIGAEMRVKLARISVALACRLNSVDDRTGETVIVYPAHVRVAYEYLEENYNSKVMGYKEYSEQRKREKQITDTTLLNEHIQSVETISMLLDSNKFQLQDIADVFNINKTAASDFAADMRKNRIMKKVHTFYVKTPAFITYLKRKKAELEGKKAPKGMNYAEPEEVNDAIDDPEIPF